LKALLTVEIKKRLGTIGGATDIKGNGIYYFFDLFMKCFFFG
jgi:hypothetical protein